ncbi:TRAF3-interacting protein 1 isoform X7 [Sciurus carolinensis]|uniref:TRAF3-interacting protein 1 isoform X7 n=1 Tax=Sciurus carolinensis TaxID=30640 RepID=UPI001FB3BB42|nr:TRAF3-interacting protein 1 isoform X7 [Sciurus carolinensis]
MNAAVVRRTQEALGKVIRRPPLTEKLLSKPPFRYLHDIVTEVIRTTGFMKGLYTDMEMKSDNVKDKDAKIGFLQKAIDVVTMVSGEPLLAKPARIVAGHEPERTNELLQIIAKCCINKLSSEDAVKRVLAGEKVDARGRSSRTSRSHESDNKNVKEEDSRAHKDREDRRDSEVRERSTSQDQKQKEEVKEESKSRDKERDKEKMKENDRDRHKEAERDKYREGEKERSRNRARPERERDRDRGNKDREAERERERRGEAGREKERPKDRDKGKDRERRRARNGEHSRDPDREKSREPDKLERKAEISTAASRSLTSKTSKRRSKNSVEDDNSTSLWRENIEPDPAVKQKGDSISDAEGEAGPTQDKSEVSENPEAPGELPSSARRIPRPGSARPAPPRVKRQESAETLMADRTGSGKTVSNVIIDSQNSDNEEDDQFVVEAAPQISEMSEIEMVPAMELENSEKHGGLVKKILETKKDYEKLQQSPKPGEKEKSFVFESSWKKEKDIVSKEIEKLRVSIQTLCKSALPLGKIMDYIQEDVDAMQNELQLWHMENKQHAEALQKEQSVTDCAVEPLKVELAELEQMIKDQQDKICAVKANILKNEEKIQKMVYSINLTSRR